MFLRTLGKTYVDGPLVLNWPRIINKPNYPNFACSQQYGTLQWASEQCNKDPDCKWIHDYKCRHDEYRYCTRVDMYQYRDGHGGPGPGSSHSCSKVQVNGPISGNYL